MDSYEGNTFVAFLDISGFKELMKKDSAWDALDTFYNLGYEVTNDSNHIEGIFVSDSGILFCRNQSVIDKYNSLREMLSCVKRINQEMAGKDFMLTTSIAYGHFRYQNRIVTDRNTKTPIFGNAYLEAYIDNEMGKPKMQPGQCRILINDVTKDIFENQMHNGDPIFSMVKSRDTRDKHYYYYWMVSEMGRIEEFENLYNDSYNLKYSGMLNSIKYAMDAHQTFWSQSRY